MTNADKLFELFGGVRQLAELIGYDEGGISRWNKDHRRGGKGRIPVRYNLAILDAAKEVSIPEAEVMELLDWHCPCCGQRLTPSTDAIWMKRRVKT